MSLWEGLGIRECFPWGRGWAGAAVTAWQRGTFPTTCPTCIQYLSTIANSYIHTYYHRAFFQLIIRTLLVVSCWTAPAGYPSGVVEVHVPRPRHATKPCTPPCFPHHKGTSTSASTTPTVVVTVQRLPSSSSPRAHSKPMLTPLTPTRLNQMPHSSYNKPTTSHQ